MGIKTGLAARLENAKNKKSYIEGSYMKFTRGAEKERRVSVPVDMV